MSRYPTGKLPYVHDERTLDLADYVDFAALPTPPTSLDLTHYVPSWPMFGNDRLGDCTCAGIAHYGQLVTSMAGKEITPTEKAVETLYYTIGKQENPNDGPHPDNGLVEQDVLKYLRSHSLGGNKVYAFTLVNRANHDHIKLAVEMFGGLYIGFLISDPNKLFDEFDRNVPWTPQAGTPTEGHAVTIVGYDADTVTVITWGRTQRGTWAWFDAMCDEAWAIIPTVWNKAKPINGFDFATLNADLKALTS